MLRMIRTVDVEVRGVEAGFGLKRAIGEGKKLVWKTVFEKWRDALRRYRSRRQAASDEAPMSRLGRPPTNP